MTEQDLTGNQPARGTKRKQAAHENRADRSARLKRIAYKLLVLIATLSLLAAFNVVYLLLVVIWLPDATLRAIIDDPTYNSLHRLHDSILPIISWSLLIGVGVQLFKPQDRLAPLLMALTVPTTITLVELSTGTFVIQDSALPLAIALLLVLLHPAAKQLARLPRFDRIMAGLTLLATAAWSPFAVKMAQFQLLAPPGDTHAAMEHWNRMAFFALFVVMWGLIGASDFSGWRLVAWLAGLASVWYGLQSLLFPVTSAADPLWAAAAIVWGVIYIAMGERRARIKTVEPFAAAAQQA